MYFASCDIIPDFRSLINFYATTKLTEFLFYSLTFNLVKFEQRYIIEIASVSATSYKHNLSHLRPCNDMVADPAFGPKIEPKLRKDFS